MAETFRHLWCGLFILVLGCHSDIATVNEPIGEPSHYRFPVTIGLNLHQTVLEVVTAGDTEGLLQNRILTRFTQEGLPLPAHRQASDQDVVLRFTQQQIPLDAICPKKVFYMPRRELLEPVFVKRNGERILTAHMPTVDDSGVRDPLPLDELMNNLDRDTISFITNYNLGVRSRERNQSAQEGINPPKKDLGTEPKLRKEQILQRKHGATEQLPIRNSLTVFEEEVWGSLKGLDVDSIFFPQLSENQVWAKPAQSQWISAGLPLRVYLYETKAYKAGASYDAVEISLKVNWESLEGTCPGYGLYKLGLVVREPVLIERNGLDTRTNTWGSYKIVVRPAVSLKEAEEDQFRLINRFIHDFKMANE
jgi:hypothetical protein